MTLEDKKIALLSGDGIGPEVIEESVKVLNIISQNSDINFSFIEAPIGAGAIDLYRNPFPDKTKDICDNCDAILFGAIGDPKYDNNPKAKIRPEDGLLAMRKHLGLYANIRPVKVYDSLVDSSPLKPSILKNTDFIVFRELTGGIYFGEKGLDQKKSGELASELNLLLADYAILYINVRGFMERRLRKIQPMALVLFKRLQIFFGKGE